MRSAQLVADGHAPTHSRRALLTDGLTPTASRAVTRLRGSMTATHTRRGSIHISHNRGSAR